MSRLGSLVPRLPLALLAALLLWGQAANAQEVKIGYFDIKRILAEVDEAKAAKDRLQRDFDQKQNRLNAMREELERLQREFEQKAPVFSQQQKEQMAIELQTKAQEAQRLFMELQGDLAQKEQMAVADLIGKLEPVVRDLAAQEGYTYVFEKSEGGLFVAPTGHDLTSEVIRRYNTRYTKANTAKSNTSKTTKGSKK